MLQVTRLPRCLLRSPLRLGRLAGGLALLATTGCLTAGPPEPATVELAGPPPDGSGAAPTPSDTRPTSALPQLPPPSTASAPAPLPDPLQGDTTLTPTAPLSPPFVARFATVHITPTPGAAPKESDEASVTLHLEAGTCEALHPAKGAERPIEVHLAWRVGNTNTFVRQISATTHTSVHRGSLEILAAPIQPGKMGRIRLREGPELNVTGGDIDALLCP